MFTMRSQGGNRGNRTGMASRAFHPDILIQQLQALAQPSRFAVLRLLARYEPFGLVAGDIARLIAVPHNTLSTHLSELEHAGLVRSRRDGRRIVYALDRLEVQNALDALTSSLKPRDRQARVPSIPLVKEMACDGPVYQVLVLCTGNSARSIMAEALINREGLGRFRAHSAGAKPRGQVDPMTIHLLADLGYDVDGLHSKSWQSFGQSEAPQMDFIITVCDDAAGEKCPHWPGHPLVAHWGVADPSATGQTDAERQAAFRTAYRHLSSRVAAFVNLPIEQMSPDALKVELAAIGRLEGASPLALAEEAA